MSDTCHLPWRCMLCPRRQTSQSLVHMINAFREVNLVTWEPRDRAATWHDSVKRSEEKRRVYLAEGTAYAKIMNV